MHFGTSGAEGLLLRITDACSVPVRSQIGQQQCPRHQTHVTSAPPVLPRPAPLTDTPHEPDVIPTATALPLWNTMAFFKVQPGFSFHSIQVGWAG